MKHSTTFTDERLFGSKLDDGMAFMRGSRQRLNSTRRVELQARKLRKQICPSKRGTHCCEEPSSVRDDKAKSAEQPPGCEEHQGHSQRGKTRRTHLYATGDLDVKYMITGPKARPNLSTTWYADCTLVLWTSVFARAVELFTVVTASDIRILALLVLVTPCSDQSATPTQLAESCSHSVTRTIGIKRRNEPKPPVQNIT
ncbi:hypothetical protein VTL71DRAFT_6882 [Oculimacula yallundae]|uniref:Uncharacterized protein n=1 Tax=Oculimacula yallundae TaxID=86028 RepID=A0ABR4BV35_9HELO